MKLSIIVAVLFWLLVIPILIYFLSFPMKIISRFLVFCLDLYKKWFDFWIDKT